MNEIPADSPFILWFVPERWCATELFSRLVRFAVAADRSVVKGASSAQHHLDKHAVLVELMNTLRPTLAEDDSELEAKGYSPARRTRTYAALIEILFCELYACLDGVKRSIHGAYRGVAGLSEKSTQKLFRRAHHGTLGPDFPEALRALLSDAQGDWFPRLASIRTELEHGLTGTCSRDRKTGTLRYMHQSLPGASAHRSFVIQDVEAEADRLNRAVRELSDRVFEFLFESLRFQPVRIMCGIYRGRCYERTLVPSATLTRHSGLCYSRTWFESDGAQRCPLAAECGAYRANSDGVPDEGPAGHSHGV